MRHYLNYTNDDLIKAVSESYSTASVLKKLGLIPAGGNHFNIERKIAQLNLDTSHFTKQAWNRGESLKEFKEYKKPKFLKNKLIKLRGHQCESCKLTEWLGKIIPIELHHLNGDRKDNIDGNLQLLCPNCHAMTKNYRRKKSSL